MHPLTRTVLAVGTALTAGTGLGLWLFAADTDDYWAWTIRAPLSAAFLGAGYAAAAVSLALALLGRRGPPARPVLVSALAFTTLSLAITARHSDDFRLGEGPALPRIVAWIWLAVYIVLPPLVLIALVLEVRRGGGEPRARRLSAGVRLALGGLGAALAAVGLPLLVGWQSSLDRWPWPLAPLAGALVGAWLLAAAASLAWVALRERDWHSARPSAGGAAVFGVLLLASALRFRDDFESGSQAAAYICVVTAALTVLATAALAAERRGGGASVAAAKPES